MIIDYLQLAVFFISNNFPWTLRFTAWYWKWLSWVCFTNMFPPVTGLGNGNYMFYEVVFYALTAILIAAFALCVLVGHSFKTGTFTWIWPIKALKVAVSFFFEVFYISSLGIFCVSLDCTYYRPGPKVAEKFPNVQCFTMPHLASVVISFVTSFLAMSMAFLMSIANSELDPLASSPAGQATHRSAVKRFALISIITLVNEIFPSYTQIQGVVCLIITFYLMYNYIRYVPYHTPWTNGLQVAFFTSLCWASCVIVLTAFIYKDQTVPLFTTLLWAGMLPAIVAAWALLYCRLRWAHRVACRYRVALATKVPVIHKFFDELEVEVVSRCARITDQWGERVPEWVDTAEAVLKAGLEQFPESAFLHIRYSSFLIGARKQNQRAAGMLDLARKLEPGLGERFMLFVRDREQKQRQGAGGSDGSYDLLSYNSYRAIVESHTGALKAIRNFWRQLVRRDVKFGDLTNAFVTMDAAEKRAELTYKTVLDKYPSSAKLLRAYGRFLEDVRSNPWGAQRYYGEAEKLELESRESAQEGPGAEGEGNAGAVAGTGDERSLNQMVDDSSDAIVVTNDAGIIQFCNKSIADLWGYVSSELQGKNVSILMGGPAASHHNQFLQRYKKTGQCTVMGTTRLVVGLHKEGHSFPVSMSLKEVKHGDSKSYMGIMRPAKEDTHTACVWVGTAGQVVGVDRGFSDMFGWTHGDLVGQQATTIGADESFGRTFAEIADKVKKWEFKQEELGRSFHQATLKVRHKYGAAVDVETSAQWGGSANMRVIVLRFELDERVESLGLVSVNPVGAIMYCNATFEAMLGFEPGALLAKKRTLMDLLKGASARMHLRWLQTAARNIDANITAPTSCRTSRVVLLTGKNGQEMPVRLVVEPCLVGRVRVLTATVTKQPITPADAWGGGDIKDMMDGAKRLMLLMRGDGKLLTFKADSAVLSRVFGQEATALVKKTVSELVPDFLPPAAHHGPWPTEAQLLHALATHSSAAASSGARPSFRVGVLPDANVMGLRARMALGSSGTVASRMVTYRVGESEVDVPGLVDEGCLTQQDVAVEGGLLVVELWQEQLLEAIVEIDGSLKVKSMDAEGALLLGHTRESAKNQPVLNLLRPQDYRLPHGARAEDFLGIKRSQLKHTADAAVSEKQNMEAQHDDGSTLAVQVQGADRHGDGSRWSVRVTVNAVQPQAGRRPTLLEVLVAKTGAAKRNTENESEASEAAAAQGDDDDENKILALQAGGAKRAASEASASEKDDGTSVGDGTSIGGASDGADASSDFQRAKRFKKLNRMLNSPQARMIINALHRYSMAMLLCMVVLHVALFAVSYQKVQSFNGYLTNTINSGEAATMAQKLLYSSRVKMSAQDSSNPYSYHSTNSTWAAELAAQYTPFVLEKADAVDDRMRWVYMGTSDKKQVPPVVPALKVLFISEVLPVQQMMQTTPATIESHNMSLWDLARRFTTAARFVAVPAPQFASQLIDYSEYQFMRRNQKVLSDALLDNLEMSEDRAHIGVVKQTLLMAVFLGAEAGLFVPLCCLALYILLTLVNKARLRTFNVFTVLPRPVVMQLASKDIKLRLEDEEEDEDGDDGDDVWMRQAQQGQDEAAEAAKGGKFKFNSQRRKLTNNSAQSYVLMAPFIVWAAIVLLTYGISIVLLRSSIKPVTDLAAAQKLHYYTSRLVYTAQKLAVVSTAAEAAAFSAEVLDTVESMAEYREGLLYGSEALGLTGSALVGNDHEDLWFGTGCMKPSGTGCMPEEHPYYEATHFGLNRLVNAFLDAAQQLAKDDFMHQSLANPAFQFMWAVGQEGGDLDAGMLRNTADFSRDGKKRMLTISIIQILAVVAMVLIMAFFWMRQLKPFMQRAKQESRRVAELLSQLPADMAVEELVMEAASMDTKAEDKAAEKAAKERAAAEAATAAANKVAAKAASAAGRGSGGGGLTRLFSGGKGKVAPAPASGGKGGALAIVVSTRTSKDAEGAVGAGPGDAARQAKYASYHERMHRHRTNDSDAQDDPALWVGRSPRKITFGAPQFSP
ncbi:flagellar associated membrane [Micractinium conductrix]|uniref:Flagellar associated membrane n=1 Tax=Micractinium conductrix TaxID=554055 RepID=A0A2P6VCE4_9CHLO|nr:flagellar associated membrane [Micractinium conductrix]|eukprot:PSC71757.1 flagellar associated membrane [Micractinium conductrix]